LDGGRGGIQSWIKNLLQAGSATLSGHPIRSGAEYIESLRGRNLKVYLMGELVAEPVDHPIIRPSINAVAETYDLANSNPELASPC
jgi:4-hydroxybutyryl-CoA dehydratase / vinylacetyl-CoA-Delta-isomerase